MTLQETIDGNLAIIESFLQDKNAPTTYDEVTLEWLEQYIIERRSEWSAEAADRINVLVGCFLGECVRRKYGGEWVQTETDTVVIIEGIHARPFASVQRVIDAEPFKSIVSFYRTLPAILEHSKKQAKQQEDTSQNETDEE